jgi:hypothetical protein
MFKGVGGGADVRLAGAIPEEHTGLRAVRQVERGDDQNQFNPSHSNKIKSRFDEGTGAF